ncbi:MAG: hypothetical protein JL50_19425 [Peptococcaceae bacterium BICA1-7]|nr:MAG: hypothetical protein JL50_19425 [Peptococcaceae bacterium BICA1-7]
MPLRGHIAVRNACSFWILASEFWIPPSVKTAPPERAAFLCLAMAMPQSPPKQGKSHGKTHK